jgi:hypothetical protein
MNPDSPEAREAVDRYCAGRMSEREQERFETELVADPKLAAEVELTRKMRAGLRELERRGEIQALTVPPSRTRNRWLLPAAAVIVMGVGAALLYRWTGPSRGALSIATSLAEVTHDPGAPPRMLGTFVLTSTRARARETEIVVPAGKGVIQLRALPDAPPTAAGYQIELMDLQTGVQTSRDRVTPNPAGLVEIYLDVAAIRPGEYELRVRPAHQPGGADTETQFHVRFAVQE